MEQTGSNVRSGWDRWRNLIVEVGVGIALGALFAFWRATDIYEGPLPGIKSMFGAIVTIVCIGLAGVTVTVFARSRPTRRRGLGLLLIAVVSVMTWIAASGNFVY